MAHTPESRRRAYEKMKARRLDWFSINGPCAECGSGNRLEMDHVDPATKVSHCVWSWREDRMLAELAKCQVLCHDCHEAKTARENSERMGGLRHGTDKMYGTHGCRCEPCRLARKTARAANRARRKVLGLPRQ